jgi:hypothetical protein
MMSLQHRRDRAYGKKGKEIVSFQEEREWDDELTGRKKREWWVYREKGKGIVTFNEERERNDGLQEESERNEELTGIREKNNDLTWLKVKEWRAYKKKGKDCELKERK